MMAVTCSTYNYIITHLWNAIQKEDHFDHKHLILSYHQFRHQQMWKIDITNKTTQFWYDFGPCVHSSNCLFQGVWDPLFIAPSYLQWQMPVLLGKLLMPGETVCKETVNRIEDDCRMVEWLVNTDNWCRKSGGHVNLDIGPVKVVSWGNDNSHKLIASSTTVPL